MSWKLRRVNGLNHESDFKDFLPCNVFGTTFPPDQLEQLLEVDDLLQDDPLQPTLRCNPLIFIIIDHHIWWDGNNLSGKELHVGEQEVGWTHHGESNPEVLQPEND
jgi:hypothetical protein